MRSESAGRIRLIPVVSSQSAPGGRPCQDLVKTRGLFSAPLCCLLWGSAFPAVKLGYAWLRIGADDIPAKFVFAGCRFALTALRAGFLDRRHLQQKADPHPRRDGGDRVQPSLGRPRADLERMAWRRPDRAGCPALRGAALLKKGQARSSPRLTSSASFKKRYDHSFFSSPARTRGPERPLSQSA